MNPDQSFEQDYLTGLANRRALYEYYSQIDASTMIHAMFLDIDNFKRVNDIYGHSMGDKLLSLSANFCRITLGDLPPVSVVMNMLFCWTVR